MKRILTTVLALGAALILATGAGAGEKIRIGTEGAYPPFNFVDKDGRVQGFEVELGNAMCEVMKAECEWVVQDWDGIIPGLQAKKYDAVIASLYITDDRKKKIDFSKKYYQTPGRFVARKGANIEISAAGLKGKIVGLQRATSFERFMNATYPDVELRLYATQDEVNLDMIAGRIDLVLADTLALLEGFLKQPDGKDFEFTGPAFSDPRYFGYGAGVAVRKDSGDLVDKFNKAIDQLRADGTYDKIRAKWFDVDIYGR
jgi:lysine-arginine-ornithine-binding protein